VLNEYQEKIEDTMSDLTEHLRRVDDRLQTLVAQRINDTEESETEWDNLRSEQESIQQCINICTDVAAHIDSVRPKIAPHMSPQDDRLLITTIAGAGVSAQRDTDRVLVRCKDDLTTMLSQMRDRLHDVTRRQETLSQQHSVSEDQAKEKNALQEELDSIKQSLKICEEAFRKAQPDRTNIFEDITMAEDGHQIMVSTFGDLVCARRVNAGARAIQWLGQMSDESLQGLSHTKGQASSRQSS
jgi:predicted  nucleic acid-binding Zn-ribbon protein